MNLMSGCSRYVCFYIMLLIFNNQYEREKNNLIETIKNVLDILKSSLWLPSSIHIPIYIVLRFLQCHLQVVS